MENGKPTSTTHLAMSSREPHNSARRSRSPHNRSRPKRSRSPRSHHHHHVPHKHKRSKPSAPLHLPFQASKLDKHAFEAFKPMFELYLDIQKQKVLEELPDDEVKGRWKSFVSKWFMTRIYQDRYCEIPGADICEESWRISRRVV